MNNIKAQIETLMYENAPDFEIAKVIKKEIKNYFYTLEESFATSGGKDFLVKHTKKIDTILKLIFKVAQREMFGDYAPMKNSIPLSLVALGSYGREQLCVYSDIDLMIVYKEIPGYNTKEMIEKILYILWDTGLKLGHRVHTVEELYEVSKTDITIKTALIESRFIEGSAFIWTETQNAIAKIRRDDIAGFIRQKRQEQHQKHTRFPLTMEPNLKEGVGGFRDANLVYWIGKVLYNTDNIKSLPSHIVEEKFYKTFRIALEFLFRVRSALHLATGKKEDRLRLDLIPKVSELLGYEADKQGHMKCAKKVTESLKIVRLYSTIWLEKLTRAYATPQNEVASIVPEKENENFHTLLRTLSQNATQPFIVHPTFLKALIDAKKPDRPNDALYKTIAKLFYQPYTHCILASLSYARLLKYTISPIKKVIDLPQFDGYHQYAVDIHSLRALYHLERLDDPFLLSLFEALSSDEKAMLKLVVFLHDAGKGRKRDHHHVGASLFKVFAQKLHLSQKLIEMGEQLILHHTLMSNIAQREDIYNEKIILGFASHFPSQTMLSMIYLLTYADMSGVGSDIYNSFSAKLIKTLYTHSLEVLNNTKMLDEAAKRAKKEQILKKNTHFLALKKSEQKKILNTPSNLLFLRYSSQRIVDIAKKAFTTQTYSYHISNEKHLTLEIIRVDDFNLSYLLSTLNYLDIVNMDICKLFDGRKYFKIDFAQSVTVDDLDFIRHTIAQAFHRQRQTLTSIPTIQKEEVTISCNHSKNYAIMHLRSKNQKGLLAYIIEMFDEMGIDIVTAKVHTIKNRVRDMFLIEKNGNFCHNTDKIIEKLTRKS